MASIFVGFLLFCGLFTGHSPAMAYTGEGQATLLLKSGSEGQFTDAMSVAPTRFAERIKERTKGKVQITHYPASQLGTWRQMLESIKGGALAFMVSGLTGTPIYDAINLPYIFRDPDHCDKVVNSPIGTDLAAKYVEKSGIRIFGWVYRGYRHCTLTKVAVRTPADMKGMKFRVPETPVYLETWRAIGARPTPMAWAEVYTGLQQGTIDGQENPLDIIISGSLFEVQKYLVLTGHVLPPGWVQMSDKVWQNLTHETQKLWLQTWNEVSREVREELLKQESKYLETWKAKGGLILEPNVAAFREATKDVWKKFAPKAWGEGVYEKIQAVK